MGEGAARRPRNLPLRVSGIRRHREGRLRQDASSHAADAVVTDSPTTDAPIMLRADITRAELADLKVMAINAGLTTL